jgi:hypothetical protein
LENAQEEFNTTMLKLIERVRTRWNSEFYMIERLYDIREIVLKAMSQISSTSLPEMLRNDWLIGINQQDN